MKEYLLKSGLFDRPRRLILSDSYIEWENSDLKGQEFTKVPKSDIIDFKYGVDAIIWYKFSVGRRYTIAVKHKGNKELSINFCSYFGLNKQYYAGYIDMLQNIWKYYHSSIVARYIDQLQNKKAIQILGFNLNEECIELGEKRKLVPWNQIAAKDYFKYFAVYNENDPDTHVRVSYNDFGAETLRSIIRYAVREGR